MFRIVQYFDVVSSKNPNPFPNKKTPAINPPFHHPYTTVNLCQASLYGRDVAAVRWEPQGHHCFPCQQLGAVQGQPVPPGGTRRYARNAIAPRRAESECIIRQYCISRKRAETWKEGCKQGSPRKYVFIAQVLLEEEWVGPRSGIRESV